ncbi:lysoplasmalogenase TMEM86A-like isoform X3 [Narcine bancroftii]
MLVPFFTTVCIHTFLSHLSSTSIWVKGLSKILPIICLCIFILDNGKQFLSQHHRVQKLLAGLLLSAAGDTLLLMDNRRIFVGGAASFALAHCVYSWVFGFKPLNLRAGGLIGAVVTAGWTLLSLCLKTKEALLLSCYCALIGVMAWRANSQVLFHSQRLSARATGAVGAWLFMISDFILATNLLCFPIPFQRIIVMTTYYMAQLLITLAILRESKNKVD